MILIGLVSRRKSWCRRRWLLLDFTSCDHISNDGTKCKVVSVLGCSCVTVNSFLSLFQDILPVTPMAICSLLFDCCNCIFWCVFKSNKDGIWNAIGKQRWLLECHRKTEMAFELPKENRDGFWNAIGKQRLLLNCHMNTDGFWIAIGKQRWLLDCHRKTEIAFALP